MLEQYAGKCVLFKPGQGVLCETTSISMDVLIKESAKIKIKGKPFVFHVPSKEELGSPIPVLK
jgi:hypothetical protein